jgi:hypothetical protein
MGSRNHEHAGARLAPIAPALATRPYRVKAAAGGCAPLRSAFCVIYCSMIILVFALPGPVIDWLDDLPPYALVETCKSAVGVIEKASQKIGLAQLYQEARGTFLKLLPRRH